MLAGSSRVQTTGSDERQCRHGRRCLSDCQHGSSGGEVTVHVCESDGMTKGWRRDRAGDRPDLSLAGVNHRALLRNHM